MREIILQWPAAVEINFSDEKTPRNSLLSTAEQRDLLHLIFEGVFMCQEKRLRERSPILNVLNCGSVSLIRIRFAPILFKL